MRALCPAMTIETYCLSAVMPGFMPGIHAFSGYLKQAKTWMAGT